MQEFCYTVKDPSGLHARPAGRLATFAKQFDAEIRVKCEGREADAKRLLSLMSLGAVQGSMLCFCVAGEQEEETARSLERFCKDSFSGDGSV